MASYGPPLAQTLDEAHRLADIIVKENAPLRLLGGTAIYLHSPSAGAPPLSRTYNDLDLVGLSDEREVMERTLELAGYQPDREFNATLRLQYVNSASTKAFRHLFCLLDEVGQSGARVTVDWEFDAEDDALEELGLDLADGLTYLDVQHRAIEPA